MDIQKSAGIKGKKNQQRIEIERINEDFVVDFPLSPFQKQAIEIIYSMRAVKTSQLVDITGYNYKYVTGQMLELHLNRFIYREFPPRDRKKKGTDEAYYLLDDAGAIYVSGAYEIQMKDVRWRKRDNLVKSDKLEHTFRVADVRAMIEKEAREQGHKVLKCIGDRHLEISFTFENERYEFRPDMYLKYSDGKYEYDFLFEVDLGTMNYTGISPKTQAFDRKVPVYEYYKLSEEYKRTFDSYPKILVITTTTDRAKKLREAVREKQKARPEVRVEFLFTSMSLWKEMCTGSIFIDTSDDAKYKSIFDDIRR